ncbi:MAG: RHS repeat-associated core domain-containing protein [Akkermansia sp.]|nr:RHS repeat-associated core domain-containing protein [Akkermansia sp.]
MKSVKNAFERVLCRQYNNRTYLYNFLAMPVQISDDAGVRDLAYNSFNELETEEQCKLSCFVHPCLWLITRDPTQPVATRPLAIQKDETWYTYGWDLTKNICEIFGQNGYICSTYTYTPFGSVTDNGDITQPIQWSSEYYDNELALVYYNYRHYNPMDGRWINRDPIAEQGGRNLYGFVGNSIFEVDYIGLALPNFDMENEIFYTDRRSIFNAAKKDPETQRYMLGETIMHWPEYNFAKCCGSNLILKFPNNERPHMDVHYYWVPLGVSLIDKKGRDVIQHEAQHINDYAMFWNMFVNKINSLETKYQSHKQCCEQVDKIRIFYSIIKKKAQELAIKEDKESY